MTKDLKQLPTHGALLALLIASGLVLAVYYNPWHAFASLGFIGHEVNNGWLVRAYHTTGTTLLFGLVYLYLFRAMATRGYRAPGELAWVLGVKLLAVLLLVGWLGFVLTGGAASYWSLFRATNGALALSGAAGALGGWFFGGPMGSGTLARLELFHAVLALGALAVLGVLFSVRRGAEPKPMRVFLPYYLAVFAVLGLIFSVLAFFVPHLGQPAVNALPGDPLTLPLGTALPWYLLPLAGIASALPGIWGGILGVVGALAVLAALPWLDRSGPEGAKGRLYCFLNGVLALDVVALGITAAARDCQQASLLLVLFTLWYFVHFLVLIPFVTAMEAK
jgi:quinol-cytochrome oxidoreductase complex cytochrome b subunit